MKNEIILYSSNELAEHIEVRLDEETVWLTQQQMTTLFNQTKQNISLHINNCFKENELETISVVKESLTTAADGKKYVTKLYNLDVIISVGYRIKSKQGTQFRIWANTILKDYLLKGYAINNRINRLEDNLHNLTQKVNQIDFTISTHQIPTQGVFFEGQIFDAYELISKIIKTAQKQIILIDNYIDESVLVHLAKKNRNVAVHILAKTKSKQLELDIQKANEQYGNFSLKPFSLSHDRFIIIDDKEVYHIGASLKDLGKKWFAFTKLEVSTVAQLLTTVKEVL